MKLLIVVLIALVIVPASLSASYRQSSDQQVLIGQEKLKAVELPGWRLHFGLFELPALNRLQQAKIKVRQLQAEIAAHEQAIAERTAEIERISNDNRETENSSYFMLGLYGRTTSVKDHEVVFDEKSILWGAIKWGKRRP